MLYKATCPIVPAHWNQRPPLYCGLPIQPLFEDTGIQEWLLFVEMQGADMVDCGHLFLMDASPSQYDSFDSYEFRRDPQHEGENHD